MDKYTPSIRSIAAVIIVITAVFVTTGCSFIDLVKNGTPQQVSDALKKGANVNRIDGGGDTPLTAAILYNKNPYEVALVLIEHGASVNLGERPPLYCALRLKDPDLSKKIAGLLISKGADVNKPGGFSSTTPLMDASSRTDGYELASLLIESGADINSVDVRRESPLHYAASVNGNSAIIELLIKHGAAVNAGTPSFTPLHRAAYMNSYKNIKTLMKHRAQINIKGDTSESKTPLELAVDMKHFESAKELVDAGADINTTSYYRYQPFRYRDNKQTVAQKMVQVDLDTIRFEKMTPLHRTVTHNAAGFTDYLLKKGARSDIQAHFGGYPLDFAVYLKHYEISEILVKHRAPSLFADLYLARECESGDYRNAEILLKSGADLRRADIYGDTPLHIAAAKGHADIVRLLIENGADKKIRNKNGKTPADLAQNDELKSILAAQ